MPFVKPIHRTLASFAESEASLDVQRRIWHDQPDFWGEVIPAAFALENTVGAWRENREFPLSGEPPAPDFDPFDVQRNRGTIYEEFPELLLEVDNLEDWEIVRKRAENERDNLRTVSESPHMLGAFLMAAVVDPINLLPVGLSAPAKGRALLSMSAKAVAARTMRRGAQAGFVGNLQAEAMLQKYQHFRTPGQTAANIGAGTLLGGMIGTAAVPFAVRRRALAEIHAAFGEPEPRTRQKGGEPTVFVKTDLRGTELALPGAERNYDVPLPQNTPLHVEAVDAARAGTIVNPDRPIVALSDADVERGLDNWHWVENTRTTHGEKPHTTTFMPASKLGELLPHIEGRPMRPPEGAQSRFQLRRPRLWVMEKNPKRATEHVASEMEVVAYNEVGSLAHLKAYSPEIDPMVPVEILIVRPTKKNLKMLAEGKFDPASATVKKFPKHKVPEAVSLGRLRAHALAAEPASYRLERSITCASPCRVKSQEDILDEGHTVPGGYQRDGTIGVSAKAEELDTTGAYNPDTEATASEMKSAMGLEKLIGFMFPSVRLATSQLRLIRQVAPKLIDMQLRMEQHAEGTPRPRNAELGIKMWNYPLAKLITDQDMAWVKSRVELSGKKFDPNKNLTLQVAALDAHDLFKGAPQGGFTKHEFMEEVGRAMRRQLDGEKGSDNPHVEAAAVETRRVWDALFSAAEEVGIMDPIVRVDKDGNPTTRVFSESGEATADSYFRRVFKKRLLKKPEERLAFITRIQDLWIAKYGLEPHQARRAGEKVYDHIMGSPAGRTPAAEIPGLDKLWEEFGFEPPEAPGVRELFKKPDVHQQRKPSATRPRSLDVHDLAIERWLEDDAQMITRFMFRTMVPDIEIARVFGAIDPETGKWKGDPDMTAALAHLEKEVQDQVAMRTKRGDPAETIAAFEKKARADIEDLANLRDLLRGQYAVPANPEHGAYQAMQSFRMVNYITMGGGFMLSSMPDVARLVTVNGLEHTFNTAWAMVNTPKNIKTSLLAEARLSGTAWEVLLNQRAANVFDLSDDYSRMSRIQLGLRATADRFAVLSLLSPWNDMMKRWAGIYTGQLMARHVSDWVHGRATPAQIERMAFWGWDYSMAKEIFAQIDGHQLENGIWHLDTPNWTSAKAQDAFRMALGSEIDRTIITPNAGDVPLMLNSEVGRTVFQFKRFALAATKTMLLSGLQWRDMQALNGALLGVGMGAMVVQAKAWQYDYPVPQGRDFLLAAIDRSGHLGIIPDFNNALGYATKGDFVLGETNRYRYSKRDFSDVLLGPSRGTVRNVTTAGSGLAKLVTGNWDQVLESEIRAAARLSGPYSLFYMTRLYQKGIKEASKPGLRARRAQRKARKERGSADSTTAGESAMLNKGEFTYLEMAYEDRGVDGLVRLANERHDYHHDSKPISLMELHKLRTSFTDAHIAGLKHASDTGGIKGMVDYLRAIAGETR